MMNPDFSDILSERTAARADLDRADLAWIEEQLRRDG